MIITPHRFHTSSEASDLKSNWPVCSAFGPVNPCRAMLGRSVHFRRGQGEPEVLIGGYSPCCRLKHIEQHGGCSDKEEHRCMLEHRAL